MTMMVITPRVAMDIANDYEADPLKMLHLLGGYYNGLDSQGKVIGELVTYATEYEPGKRFVGWEYANWAKVEMYPNILRKISYKLRSRIPKEINCYCGVPDGGRSFAIVLSLEMYQRHIYLEKKVVKMATETEKAESDLVFSRHEPFEGDVVALVEDVGNHFGSTAKSIDKVVAKGATVGAIVCIHNRSQEVRDVFDYNGIQVPVVSYLDHKMVDYRQDDPAVAKEVARGNVISDPKKFWGHLMEHMKTSV